MLFKLDWLEWAQIVRKNHMSCVMTMCANSINPFLTGTRTTLVENVITLLHRRCYVGPWCKGELGLSLRLQFVCCLIPTNNSDMHVMSEEGCGRCTSVSFLCLLLKPSMTQLLMTQWCVMWMTPCVVASLVKLICKLKGTGNTAQKIHQHTVITKCRAFSLSPNAKRLPVAVVYSLSTVNKKDKLLIENALEEGERYDRWSLK